MIYQLKKNNILFLDIETVPEYSNFLTVPEKKKELWEKKMIFQKEKENLSGSELYNRAGIFAEFGKIICISVGFFYNKQEKTRFRIKSFYGDEEKEIIGAFLQLLNNSYNQSDHFLCGHNAKEFDIPYIARRSLIHGFKLPSLLDIAGSKPWEVKHLDTMELWKFGDYKHYTSLALLTEIFNIPTPKDDIDGSDVCRVYWEEKNLKRIVEYCQKDVLAVAQLFLRYRSEPLIELEDVEII
jgi:DNA polymerase elongation subunit (family B)